MEGERGKGGRNKNTLQIGLTDLCCTMTRQHCTETFVQYHESKNSKIVCFDPIHCANVSGVRRNTTPSAPATNLNPNPNH